MCQSIQLQFTASSKTPSSSLPYQQRKSGDSTMIDSILGNLDAEDVSREDKDDAAQGGILTSIPTGLFNVVSRCCECILSLEPQLIANQTYSQAKCYMSIHCLFDGGKYFNRIQCGSFQHCCNTAGLAVQHGPAWSSMAGMAGNVLESRNQLKSWKHVAP